MLAGFEAVILVIGEAAIRLNDDAVRLCPGALWPEIRGIGNWLRHQYDRVDLPTLWHKVQDDLPRLTDAISSALRPSASKLPEHRSHETEDFRKRLDD